MKARSVIDTGPVEVFHHPKNNLGECPRWHPSENRLYWTDIERRRLFSLAPGEPFPLVFAFDQKVGCFAFRKTGGLILATSQGLLSWKSGQTLPERLADPEPGKTAARFNDGQVDAAGRFWAGTMTEVDASSCLYRFDPDFSLHTMLTGITISNGIAWSPANDRMYFTDTLTKTILVFQYDLSKGIIFDRRVFVKTGGEGLPDGLCVDMEGNVWSAQCGGGAIHVYDPTGTLIQTIEFPTRCITACCFGGPGRSDLYVTSSRSLLPADELAGDPLAGAVFKLHTGTSALPQPFFLG